MPKETFHNLPEEKKSQFINTALEEFAGNNFDTASITRIVKNLGIAKGSVYQYFEDKLDLWLYLKEYCEGVKMSYVRSVSRRDYDSFWSYYRAMFRHGINFDLEQPRCSLFLYRVGFKESSRQVREYLDSWKKKANEAFMPWIEHEKKTGAFDPSVSTETIAHFLVTMSISIAELLQSRYKVDFDENIREGKPLFAADEEALMQAVDELIYLFEKSLK
ncbi:MAG TPA: TetR/AcrR family transcriptional regulator [Flavilitoribacter sp.]|nr:TetR/AcrR family transcriptional regulator [Flavilitoribacter sp.]HMQ90436.1 TetR/AcrR family transcriptional regulator [Flavilitoribacter sp.]